MMIRTAALFVLLAMTITAHAQDAVKLSGFWIEPVTVQSIRDGQVRYLTQSGQAISRSIDQLEGLRLERYPALGRAQEALDRGDDSAATALLRQVSEQARESWLRSYADMQRVGAHARLDQAESAVGLYVDMAVAGAERPFIAEPPVEAVGRADVAVRLRIVALVKAALGAADPDRAALLQQLLDAAGNPSPELAQTDTATDVTQASGVLPLSASAPPGSIVNLYQAGNYSLALRAADEALSQPGRTAAELYLKGMAQLALAEQTSDADGYKSAGLNFMRVVTFFPRSAVAGPAWLETGYVHQKIGRLDVAGRLYQRARVLIHEDEDPAYYQRLNQLTAEVEKAFADQ